MKGIFQSLKSSFLKVIVFIFGVLFFGYLCSIFFNLVDGIYNGLLDWEAVLDIKTFNPNGLLIFLIVSACLIFEAVLLGWDESSLKRIFARPNNSLKTDIFYFFLICAGLTPVLGFLCSLGIGYALNEHFKVTFDLSLLRDSNIAIQFIVVIFVNSLIFYWHHRLFHSKYLWRFHEIHHAAEDFNLITNFRNHPIDITIRTVFYTLPAAIFGINPMVIFVYSGISGILTCFQHSELDWKMPFIEKYLIIGSKGHRVHHGSAKEYVDKNFGILVFWDWLFGTYQPPPRNRVEIGVKDSLGIHNNNHPILDLLSATFHGMRELRLHLKINFKK